jgi:amino acid permease
MPAVQTPPQDLGAIVLIVLIAAVCVTYWRTTLRIAAIVIITLAAYGAFLVVEGMRR